MRLKEIEQRLAELDEIVNKTEDIEEVKKALEERKALEEERASIIKAAEDTEKKAQAEEAEKRAAKAALLSGNPALGVVKEARKGDIKMKDIKEFRNLPEYIDAFAEYKKSGDDKEIRELLTTNVGDGTIVVPEVVMDEIKTAWDRNEILALVTNKLEVKGNIDQQFEISGDDAITHLEGSGAVAEENLSIGNVKIVPEDVIKWISLSKEVMSMRGEAFLRYVYREVSHKIFKKQADKLIGKIMALPESATAEKPNAKKVKKGTTVGTVVEAIGNLSDEATNPTVIINKLSYAAVKQAAYANGYSVDPFEGLEVRYSSQLPAYATASENDVWMIVGDFGYGCLANYPNGEAIEINIDTLTKKKEGKIEVVGDQYMGAEPVACRAFTLVTKPAAV